MIGVVLAAGALTAGDAYELVIWSLPFLGLGSVPLLCRGILAIHRTTRRFASVPHWGMLALAGWHLGILLAAPLPEGDKAPAAMVGILILGLALVSPAVTTVVAAVFLAFRSATRPYALRILAPVLAFALAGVSAYGLCRRIPEWRHTRPTVGSFANQAFFVVCDSAHATRGSSSERAAGGHTSVVRLRG